MTITNYIIQYGFSLSLLANAALFIPQIMTLLKKKSADGVSLITFLGFNIIQLFTVLHGIIEKDYLLAAGYFLSVLTCGGVSFLIFYYTYVKPKMKPGI